MAALRELPRCARRHSMQLEHPSRPQRTRVLAMSGAASIVVLGLGAFALLPKEATPPPSKPQQAQGQQGPRYVRAAENRVPPPRMLEAGAPFSFADLVERVSPGVVTVTSETQETE